MSSSYGAVTATEILVAQPVEGAITVVDLVAPSDLNPGFECPVEVMGKPMLATVPDGGVKQGKKFQAKAIPVGTWRDGILDCFTMGLCHAQFCLTYWCTPLALGQLLTRLGRNICASPSSSSATSSYFTPFKVMIAILVIYTVGEWVFVAVTARYTKAVEEDEETGQILTADELYQPSWVGMVQALSQLWQSAYGIFILVVMIRTRAYVRKRYAIPTGRCGGAEDCCCAFFCGPCTVCQLARHVNTYKSQDEAACCSDTGLAPQVSPIMV